jgi:hypothetical protein
MSEKKKNGIAELYQQWKQLKDQIEDLEKEKKVLKETLTNRIPENGTKAGIYHQASPRAPISYSKVLAEVYELVPKSKRHEIEEIKQKYTNPYTYHTFKPEE